MAFARNYYRTSFDRVSQVEHPEHETRQTRVSEYLRKYGMGKIDVIPQDTRPVVNDPRTPDEMLEYPDKLTSALGTEPLDALIEIQNQSETYKKALAEIELTKKQKADFDAAVKVLNDPNSSDESKYDAHRILEELYAAKKITRARK